MCLLSLTTRHERTVSQILKDNLSFSITQLTSKFLRQYVHIAEQNTLTARSILKLPIM